MDLLHAAILGLVQGLTEFLPISSSAHLFLVPWALGWPDHGLAFDAALHLGTIVALLSYFWRDWLEMGRAVLLGLRDPAARGSAEFQMAFKLAVGCVPAGLIGLLAEDFIETSLREPRIIAWLMIAAALVLLVADRRGSRQRGLDTVTFRDALLIGCAQALALAPGVSRSGATITAGLFLGLTRPAAARFSFLMSTPIALAAGLMQLVRLLRTGPDADGLAALALGVVVAAVSGFIAIAVLLRFLQRNPTDVFVWYRIAAGVSILLVALVPGASR